MFNLFASPLTSPFVSPFASPLHFQNVHNRQQFCKACGNSLIGKYCYRCVEDYSEKKRPNKIIEAFQGRKVFQQADSNNTSRRHHNNFYNSNWIEVKGVNDTYYYYKADLLGEGTFGKVYHGEVKRSGQTVAIKKIQLTNLQRTLADTKISFGPTSIQNEVKMLQDFSNDDNIVKILDYSVHSSEKYGYIIMEFCDSSLAHQIENKGRISERACREYLNQILKGLQKIHSYGAIHRDIKPANILLKNGVCKIADFGIACGQRMANTYAGTPVYMASEMLSGHSYTQKVDVYAAGMTMVEVMTGRYLGGQKADGNFSGFSTGFVNVIHGMTAKNQNQRLSVGEALSRLRALN